MEKFSDEKVFVELVLNEGMRNKGRKVFYILYLFHLCTVKLKYFCLNCQHQNLQLI